MADSGHHGTPLQMQPLSKTLDHHFETMRKTPDPVAPPLRTGRKSSQQSLVSTAAETQTLTSASTYLIPGINGKARCLRSSSMTRFELLRQRERKIVMDPRSALSTPTAELRRWATPTTPEHRRWTPPPEVDPATIPIFIPGINGRARCFRIKKKNAINANNDHDEDEENNNMNNRELETISNSGRVIMAKSYGSKRSLFSDLTSDLTATTATIGSDHSIVFRRRSVSGISMSSAPGRFSSVPHTKIGRKTTLYHELMQQINSAENPPDSKQQEQEQQQQQQQQLSSEDENKGPSPISVLTQKMSNQTMPQQPDAVIRPEEQHEIVFEADPRQQRTSDSATSELSDEEDEAQGPAALGKRKKKIRKKKKKKPLKRKNSEARGDTPGGHSSPPPRDPSPLEIECPTRAVSSALAEDDDDDDDESDSSSADEKKPRWHPPAFTPTPTPIPTPEHSPSSTTEMLSTAVKILTNEMNSTPTSFDESKSRPSAPTPVLSNTSRTSYAVKILRSNNRKSSSPTMLNRPRSRSSVSTPTPSYTSNTSSAAKTSSSSNDDKSNSPATPDESRWSSSATTSTPSFASNTSSTIKTMSSDFDKSRSLSVLDRSRSRSSAPTPTPSYASNMSSAVKTLSSSNDDKSHSSNTLDESRWSLSAPTPTPSTTSEMLSTAVRILTSNSSNDDITTSPTTHDEPRSLSSAPTPTSSNASTAVKTLSSFDDKSCSLAMLDDPRLRPTAIPITTPTPSIFSDMSLSVNAKTSSNDDKSNSPATPEEPRSTSSIMTPTLSVFSDMSLSNVKTLSSSNDEKSFSPSMLDGPRSSSSTFTPTIFSDMSSSNVKTLSSSNDEKSFSPTMLDEPRMRSSAVTPTLSIISDLSSSVVRPLSSNDERSGSSPMLDRPRRRLTITPTLSINSDLSLYKVRALSSNDERSTSPPMLRRQTAVTPTHSTSELSSSVGTIPYSLFDSPQSPKSCDTPENLAAAMVPARTNDSPDRHGDAPKTLMDSAGSLEADMLASKQHHSRSLMGGDEPLHPPTTVRKKKKKKKGEKKKSKGEGGKKAKKKKKKSKKHTKLAMEAATTTDESSLARAIEQVIDEASRAEGDSFSEDEKVVAKRPPRPKKALPPRMALDSGVAFPTRKLKRMNFPRDISPAPHREEPLVLSPMPERKVRGSTLSVEQFMEEMLGGPSSEPLTKTRPSRRDRSPPRKIQSASPNRFKRESMVSPPPEASTPLMKGESPEELEEQPTTAAEALRNGRSTSMERFRRELLASPPSPPEASASLRSGQSRRASSMPPAETGKLRRISMDRFRRELMLASPSPETASPSQASTPKTRNKGKDKLAHEFALQTTPVIDRTRAMTIDRTKVSPSRGATSSSEDSLELVPMSRTSPHRPRFDRRGAMASSLYMEDNRSSRRFRNTEQEYELSSPPHSPPQSPHTKRSKKDRRKSRSPGGLWGEEESTSAGAAASPLFKRKKRKDKKYEMGTESPRMRRFRSFAKSIGWPWKGYEDDDSPETIRALVARMDLQKQQEEAEEEERRKKNKANKRASTPTKKQERGKNRHSIILRPLADLKSEQVVVPPPVMVPRPRPSQRSNSNSNSDLLFFPAIPSRQHTRPPPDTPSSLGSSRSSLGTPSGLAQHAKPPPLGTPSSLGQQSRPPLRAPSSFGQHVKPPLVTPSSRHGKPPLGTPSSQHTRLRTPSSYGQPGRPPLGTPSNLGNLRLPLSSGSRPPLATPSSHQSKYATPSSASSGLSRWMKSSTEQPQSARKARTQDESPKSIFDIFF